MMFWQLSVRNKETGKNWLTAKGMRLAGADVGPDPWFISLFYFILFGGHTPQCSKFTLGSVQGSLFVGLSGLYGMPRSKPGLASC